MAAPALDSRLAEVADLLERSRWAAELWDSEWRLAWVISELRDTIGEHDEERLGYGEHLLECRLNEAWARTVTDQTRERMFAEDMAYIAADTRVELMRCGKWSRRSSGRASTGSSRCHLHCCARAPSTSCRARCRPSGWAC